MHIIQKIIVVGILQYFTVTYLINLVFFLLLQAADTDVCKGYDRVTELMQNVKYKVGLGVRYFSLQNN